MKQILLIIPFWNVETCKERSENIQYCYNAWNSFTDYCKAQNSMLNIKVELYNLGEKPNKDYPNARFIQHTDLKYRFEKPTRMNSAFVDVYERGYLYAGMVDPDVIIFSDSYEKLYKNIVNKLSQSNMLTYGFSRTKPELRNHLPNINSKHPLIVESDPYYERMPFAGGLFFISLYKFFKCGGFNVDFRVYGFDDVEFTNRWKMYGNTVSNLKIKLYHLWHPTVLGTAADDEIERYSYELKYWKKTLSYFQKWERLKKNYPPLKYVAPSIRFNTDTENTIPFDYSYGKVDLYAFPKYIQKSWGLIPNDEKFYNEKLLK